MTIDDYKGIIKDKLTATRYYHSCMVAQAAVGLAEKYGGDIKKAETAGILHDIMKDTPKLLQLQTIEKYSIILDDVESSTDKLLHAISGAAVLQYEYEISDQDIINAVRYHTTARAKMSILEKIVYLADCISIDRDYEGVGQIRTAAEESLDGGLIAALNMSVVELVAKSAQIHLDTVRARNELVRGY